MVTASFRFDAALDDFLAPDRRGREFSVACARAATTKHMIEALGIPHTEVEAILVNDAHADFDRILAEGDRVAVLASQPRVAGTRSCRLRGPLPDPPRFVADAHLGGLARLMRMAGFDTLYDNGYRDERIEAIAVGEGRIVLSRDRELLKRQAIVHGCFPHALASEQQFREVCARLGLARRTRPFSRCLVCNAPLRAVEKAQVLESLPPSVRACQQRFSTCETCGRIYWEGSHWQRMQGVLATLLSAHAV
jgi:uncharacterized protein